MQRDLAFTSEELAFLAEEEEIQIVPEFTEDVAMAIIGDFGPFTAGVPVDVPLWVALRLKRDRQCSIVTPAWMRVGELDTSSGDTMSALLRTASKSYGFPSFTSSDLQIDCELFCMMNSPCPTSFLRCPFTTRKRLACCSLGGASHCGSQYAAAAL